MAGYGAARAADAACALTPGATGTRFTRRRHNFRAAGDVSWRERARWMLLAFAPSSLMLGVTQHITSEIAAVPLLWLAPLALYVITFINAFAGRPPVKLEWTARLQPLLVILLALVWVLNIYLSVFVLHLVSFFVTALMCHANSRAPAACGAPDGVLHLDRARRGAGGHSRPRRPLAFDSIWSIRWS